jgi:hypothetical protein
MKKLFLTLFISIHLISCKKTDSEIRPISNDVKIEFLNQNYPILRFEDDWKQTEVF